MLNISRLILPLIILIGTLLSAYKNKNNNTNLDLTDSKIRNNIVVKNLKPKGKEIKEEINNNKLLKYKDQSEVLNFVKIGKKDPFSRKLTEANILESVIQLTGFLSTDYGKYAFVNYEDKKGAIREESIGGVNTNLLPNGAKVISISPKSKKLTINFDNKDYIFEL
tara:strand:+ start:91 stop:588 length:498 start_codon:yes stop_codon:yes gene_type:complete